MPAVGREPACVKYTLASFPDHTVVKLQPGIEAIKVWLDTPHTHAIDDGIYPGSLAMAGPYAKIILMSTHVCY